MRNDRGHQLTPDLPPPVEAPELWHEPQEREQEEKAKQKKRPPDPEHGPGEDTGTGEPPD